MPIAFPLSLVSHISAKVPAPTACTEAAAPPDKIRMTTNMLMLTDIAAKIVQITNNKKETRYTERRPLVSEKEDHQRGKIPRASMYKAAARLVTAGPVWNSWDI